MVTWQTATPEQRQELLDLCWAEGHVWFYIEGSSYRWDCARCNWQESRSKPTLPLFPSAISPRWELIDRWATS